MDNVSGRCPKTLFKGAILMTDTIQSGNVSEKCASVSEERAYVPETPESVHLLVSIFDSMNTLYANLKRMNYGVEKYHTAENNYKKNRSGKSDG